MTGKVKFWNSKKGFGFIVVEGRESDLFVHFSQIKTDSEYKSLKEGQEVEFEIQKLEDGREAAANVVAK